MGYVIDRLEPRRLLAAEVFDFNTSPASSSVSDIVDLDGTALFFADDGMHGRELWRSDGTSAGTYLVKDVLPGIDSSVPFMMARMDGFVYFQARVQSRRGLWRTDGTAAGTTLVKDLLTGSVSSSLSGAAVVNNRLFFAASVAGVGDELWVSDGTSEGTVLVKDVKPGSGGSGPTRFAAVGDFVYFAADDGSHGVELWRTDGTGSGTVLARDINPGSASSDPYEITAFKGSAYFRASEPSTGWELWRSDGTEAGTVLFHEYSPGPQPQGTFQIEASGDYLYFNQLFQLWRTDGTTTGTINLYINAQALTDVGGTLFFSDSSDIWKSNGEVGGRTLLNSSSGYPRNLVAAGNRLFFTANDTSTSTDLWTSDGSVSGTIRVAVLNGGYSSGGFDVPSGVGNKLFFRASFAGKGIELFGSDGSPGGSGLVKDIRPGTANSDAEVTAGDDNGVFVSTFAGQHSLYHTTPGFPQKLVDLYGTVLPTAGRLGNISIFQESDVVVTHTQRLWRSDGTAAGTSPFYSDPNLSGGFLTPFNGTIFFPGITGSTDTELWTTDGTTAGTQLFLDLNPGAVGSNPLSAVVAGNNLFFSARHPIYGRTLWVSDGTIGGTRAIQLPTPLTLAVEKPLVAVGSYVYFAMTNASTGRELWKSDGTDAGTIMVKDINPLGSSNPTSLVNVDGTLYFTADDGSTGVELWKSDGTADGTVLVKDIVPGPGSSSIASIVASIVPYGNLAVFTADDGHAGRELWRSDGTVAGTTMLRDILPGSSGANIQSVSATGGYVYFAADDGLHGREVWRTDGTSSGTILVHDVFAGANDSAPAGFMSFGDSLYFTANDAEHGRELWRLSGDFVPPTIQSQFEMDTASPQLTLTFSEPIATPPRAEDFDIVNQDTGQGIDPSTLIVTNSGLTTTIRFTAGTLPDANYQLVIPAGSFADVAGNSLTTAHRLDFFTLGADANRDRKVDTQDFNVLAANFGGAGKVFGEGNFNYDLPGVVDSIDFDIFVAQYGKRLAAPVAASSAGLPPLFDDDMASEPTADEWMI